jgi:hypothetical protein
MSSTSTETSSKGFFGSIRSKFEERSKKSQKEAYAKQLAKMAESEKWTLKDFSDEIDETLSSWRTKIPGVSNLQQVKSAKEAQVVIKAVVDEVGRDATAEDLGSLGRTEKVSKWVEEWGFRASGLGSHIASLPLQQKISLKSGISIEDLNIMIKQFQGMDMMHSVLRKRKLEGKPIPVDESTMKAALESDGPSVLSKKQKKAIQERQQRKALRGLFRRR